MRLKTDNRFHKLEVTMRQVQADVDDTKEVAKNARIADLESKLVVMQTQINSLIESSHSHTKRLIALEPDNPFHGKLFGREQPKLKQLDQSVFDGQSKEWRFAGVDGNGEARLHTRTTYSNGYILRNVHGSHKLIGKGYDTTDWQNSLIERDKVELTGSDLARAMLERGDKYVMCKVWNKNYGDINQFVDVVLGYRTDLEKFTSVEGNRTDFANPINPRTGEPLTQSEAGL